MEKITGFCKECEETVWFVEKDGMWGCQKCNHAVSQQDLKVNKMLPNKGAQIIRK